MKSRFAPSPTGPFHIGGLRTALLVQVLSEKLEGQSVLRIEDTDTQRSTLEYEKNIIDSLSWADIDFGKPCFKQSERLSHYKNIVDILLKNNLAYYCYMTQEELKEHRDNIREYNKNTKNEFKKPEKYDNRFRPEKWPNGIPSEIKEKNKHPVIRLKLDLPILGYTYWKDLTKGNISIPNEQLDDLIIVRSDGSPTYNFCVVVDDLDLYITHVIRGDDHISNTPKQIQIAKILQNLPEINFTQRTVTYCHIPLMFNPDGSKISKSALANPDNAEKVKLGLVVPASVDDYIDMGILPNALINYLLLISSQKTAEIIGSEIFDKKSFIDNFSFEHLSDTSAKFDLAKLKEINFHHIQKLDPDQFKILLIQFSPETTQIINSVKFNLLSTEIQKRSKTLSDSISILNNLSQTHLNIKNEQNNKSFYNQLQLASNHDEFKEIVTQEAKSKNLKFGELSKQIRTELNITNGLPLFEIFTSGEMIKYKPKI